MNQIATRRIIEGQAPGSRVLAVPAPLKQGNNSRTQELERAFSIPYNKAWYFNRAGIHTLADFLCSTRKQLLAIPQVGDTTVDFIERELAKLGLRLRQEP